MSNPWHYFEIEVFSRKFLGKSGEKEWQLVELDPHQYARYGERNVEFERDLAIAISYHGAVNVRVIEVKRELVWGYTE